MAVLAQVLDHAVHTHGSKRVAMGGEGFHALLTALVHPTSERIGADLQHLPLKGKLALKSGHVSSQPRSPTSAMLLMQRRMNPLGMF